MGRLLKYLGFAVLGVVALLVLVIILAAIFIDPNDYRDKIAAVAKKATGRDLVIEGDLELGLFPWVSIDVGRTTLGNAPGFGNEPMLELDGAKLGLKVLPLLTGNVEVGEVDINRVVVRLAVAADGKTNWDDIATSQTVADEPAADAGAAGTLSVAGVSLTDSTVYYTDAEAGSSYIVENLNLTTGAIAPGKPVPLKAGFDLNTGPDALAGRFDLNSTLMLDTAKGLAELDNLGLDASLTGIGEGEMPLKLRAAAIRMDSQKDTFAVEELVANLANMTVSTGVSGSGLSTTLAAAGSFTVAKFSPKELLATLGSEPIPTVDPNAMTAAEASGTFKLTGEDVAVSDLIFKLDETTFSGTASIKNAEIPVYEFALSGDAINVDRYLAPTEEGAVDAEAEAAALDATEIPVETLEGLNASGTVRLQQALMSGLEFENIELGLKAADNRLRLHPISAQLFGGTYAGDVSVDGSGKTPRLSLNETVDGVDLGKLAVAMFETKDLSGKIGGHFKLAGTGATVGAIKRTLNGNIDFALTDGALEGKDIWYQIRRARALFKQQPQPEAPANPRTEFSDVSGTGTVAEGILTNNDLQAMMPFLQATGGGTVNFVDSTIDYAVDARVLERPEFMEGVSEEELADYTEAVIPIKITGPLADASIRPDISGLLKAQVKGKIDEQKDKLRGKVLDRLGIGGGDQAEGAAAEGDKPAGEEEPADAEEELKEKAKDKLRNIFGD